MNHLINPCLWFDGKAKEAAQLYGSVFPDSGITSDTPMLVTFTLHGQKFLGLNGGPQFVPNPTISFFVDCESAREVEYSWDKLSDGGKVLMPLDKYSWSEKYGWLQDRFGISWQLFYHPDQRVGQKISPLLMFVHPDKPRAEKAIQFYTSVFNPSEVLFISRYQDGDQDLPGSVNHARFKLGAGIFMAIDSSLMHGFSFNEAISFVVECDTQEEIDTYWNQLTQGGEESRCGWLKDQFGVSWQIIPSILPGLMSDPSRSERVSQVFLQMKKLDIDRILKA
jgi:predicted 3-demethylubiquinone-9 3-methyltransferase (glyoxalase superfamily)